MFFDERSRQASWLVAKTELLVRLR